MRVTHHLNILPPPQRTAIKCAFFLLFSFFLLLWMSPDSPLMHVGGSQGDPAWYFMCGKAWMEGMVPYVDFADSKGPLLWLLNGVAYLLSPTTYRGVFAVSVVCYAVTFGYLWQTARLFAGRRTAWLTLSALSVIIMFRTVHPETKAEDFCLPWISMALYYTCLMLQHATRRDIRRGAWLTGVGLMWCLLVKWNVFFMMGGMALVMVGVSLRKGWPDALVCGLGGMALLALPFGIYFAAAGNFGGFVQEYFVNTFSITDNGTGADSLRSMLLSQVADKYMLLRTMILYGSLAGVCLFCHTRKFSWWLLLAYLPFFLFLLLKTSSLHYCSTIEPFFVFLLVAALQGCRRIVGRLSAQAVAWMGAAIYLLGIAAGMHRELLWFVETPYAQEWQAIERVMAQKSKPKVMYFISDYGYGLSARPLPACKYWARQKAATPAMDSLRMEALQQRQPDFFCFRDDLPADMVQRLQQCGYIRCFATLVENGKTVRKPLPVYMKR